MPDCQTDDLHTNCEIKLQRCQMFTQCTANRVYNHVDLRGFLTPKHSTQLE